MGRYLADHLEGNLVSQLEFGSFQALLNLQTKEQTRMDLIDKYTSEENIMVIEREILPSINLEQISTEHLIKLMKNESKRALGRSTLFKQKCKYQLRQRKQHSMLLKESEFKPLGQFELALVSPREIVSQHSPGTVSRQLRFSDSESYERGDLGAKIALSIVNSPNSYGSKIQDS